MPCFSSRIASLLLVTIVAGVVAARWALNGLTSLVSADLPAHEQNAESALRLKECGADMVKLLGSADLVRSVVRAGVPVFAEFHGGKDDATMLVDHARRLEDAGASLLDFRHSGPGAGEAVARAYAKATPERCVWGSDWPHPTEQQKQLPDDAVLFDLLSDWVPDEETRHRVLVENPATLYDFPKTS